MGFRVLAVSLILSMLVVWMLDAARLRVDGRKRLREGEKKRWMDGLLVRWMDGWMEREKKGGKKGR